MMRTILGIFISLVVFHSVKAAPCPTIRVGYTDQARPPFFLGRGPTVPEPAGMAIDLIRRSSRSSDVLFFYRAYHRRECSLR